MGLKSTYVKYEEFTFSRWRITNAVHNKGAKRMTPVTWGLRVYGFEIGHANCALNV